MSERCPECEREIRPTWWAKHGARVSRVLKLALGPATVSYLVIASTAVAFAHDGNPVGQTLMPGLHLSACGFALAAGIVGMLFERDLRP